jgi:hypothetical protein
MEERGVGCYSPVVSRRHILDDDLDEGAVGSDRIAATFHVFKLIFIITDTLAEVTTTLIVS